HAAERLSGTPKKLVANGEGAEEFGAEGELVQAADGNFEAAGDGGGREAAQRGFLVIWNDADPGIAAREELLDFGQRHVALQLDAKGLAMATHGADAHADAVHRDGRLDAEDFVRFGEAF